MQKRENTKPTFWSKEIEINKLYKKQQQQHKARDNLPQCECDDLNKPEIYSCPENTDQSSVQICLRYSELLLECILVLFIMYTY